MKKDVIFWKKIKNFILTLKDQILKFTQFTRYFFSLCEENLQKVLFFSKKTDPKNSKRSSDIESEFGGSKMVKIIDFFVKTRKKNRFSGFFINAQKDFKNASQLRKKHDS